MPPSHPSSSDGLYRCVCLCIARLAVCGGGYNRPQHTCLTTADGHGCILPSPQTVSPPPTHNHSRVSPTPNATDRQTDRQTDGQTDRRTDMTTAQPFPQAAGCLPLPPLTHTNRPVRRVASTAPRGHRTHSLGRSHICETEGERASHTEINHTPSPLCQSVLRGNTHTDPPRRRTLTHT